MKQKTLRIIFKLLFISMILSGSLFLFLLSSNCGSLDDGGCEDTIIQEKDCK